MDRRVILWFSVLLVALVLIILLWPRRLHEPTELARIPSPQPSPTTAPPVPTLTSLPSPSIPAPTLVPLTPTPAVSPTPAIDELDVLFADLAPAILAKDKQRVLDILDRMVVFGDRAVERLAVLLTNPTDQNVREFAALGLAKIGTPAALGELLKAIQNENDPRLKENLRAELRRLRNPASMDQVIDGLLQDSVEWWWKDASSILAGMGTPSVVSRLLEISGQAGEESQGRIASTLARIESPGAIPALAEALKPTAHPLIQEGASSALAKIGTPHATTTLLQAVRQADDLDYRERLLVAFEGLVNKDSVPLLQQALDDNTSPSVRAAAANALGNFDNEPILAQLERAYEEEIDPRVKDAIAEAIQRIGARSM